MSIAVSRYRSVPSLKFVPLAIGLTVVVYVYYLCGQWVFDEDRPFHTAYLTVDSVELMYKNGEVLWGVIAPYFGQLFPDYPFEAFMLTSASIGYVAIARLTGSARWAVLLMLSLGVLELLNDAARQGFAMMLFCLGLTFRHRVVRWPLLVAACFIHIVMLAGLAYLAAAWIVARYRNHWLSVHLAAIALAASAAIIGYSYVLVGDLPGSAVALLAFQVVALLWMTRARADGYLTAMVQVTFLYSAAFFLFTSTGIRGVYLFTFIAPFVLGRLGGRLAVAGLWLYPLVLMRFGAPEAFLPHLFDFWWAIP